MHYKKEEPTQPVSILVGFFKFKQLHMKPIFVDNIHEYDYSEELTDQGVIHLLFRSNNECWSQHCRGEEILSITDNSNGFVFNHSKPKKEMDYSYTFYLSILLKIISYNDHVITISSNPQLL